VAAVVSGHSTEAGALIADGAKAIKGGGGKGAELAMAGGKDPDGVDEALSLAKAAAGLAS
jgi:alanyl-tRNA synthetase